MGRRANLIPSRPLEVSLDEDLRTRLDLILFSEVEQRVPVGAYKRLLSDLIRKFLDHKRLDLEPYGFPQGFYVEGTSLALNHLKERLTHGRSNA